MGYAQAKLAVESRGYPLFRYDPDAGKTTSECFDLEGNPAPGEDWPSYELRYRQSGREKTLTVPMTFADFAITEIRWCLDGGLHLTEARSADVFVPPCPDERSVHEWYLVEFRSSGTSSGPSPPE